MKVTYTQRPEYTGDLICLMQGRGESFWAQAYDLASIVGEAEAENIAWQCLEDAVKRYRPVFSKRGTTSIKLKNLLVPDMPLIELKALDDAYGGAGWRLPPTEAQIEAGEPGNFEPLSKRYLPRVRGMHIGAAEFRPDMEVPAYVDPASGQWYANLFVPPRYAHERDAFAQNPDHSLWQGSPDVALDYIDALIPDPASRRALIGYIGYKLLNPAAVLPSVIFICTDHGSGRDTFFNFIAQLFGPTNVRLGLGSSILDPNHGDFRFNEYQAGALIGFISEAARSAGGPRSRSEDIHLAAASAAYRDRVNPGDEVIGMVQGKGTPMREARITMWLWMASNLEVPLVIDDQDRRTFAIDNVVVPPDLQDELRDAARSSATLNAFAAHCMDNAFTPTQVYREVPLTLAKRRMISGNRSPVDQDISVVINRVSDMLPGQAATLGQIVAAMMIMRELDGLTPYSPAEVDGLVRRIRTVLRRPLSDQHTRDRVSRVTPLPLPSWLSNNNAIRMPSRLPVFGLTKAGWTAITQRENGASGPDLTRWLNENDASLLRPETAY